MPKKQIPSSQKEKSLVHRFGRLGVRWLVGISMLVIIAGILIIAIIKKPSKRGRPDSRSIAEAPAIDMSDAEREKLEVSCGKLEDAFTEGDVEALTALILPQESENYKKLLSGRETELKKFGELFKTRKLVATGVDIAQYEIEDGGVLYPVTMIKIGDEWRLYSF